MYMYVYQPLRAIESFSFGRLNSLVREAENFFKLAHLIALITSLTLGKTSFSQNCHLYIYVFVYSKRFSIISIAQSTNVITAKKLT